jgi:hypothetical protein
MATKKTGAARGDRKTGVRKGRKRITFPLTPDVIRRVKVRAAMTDVQPSDIVQEALERYLKDLT